MDYKEKLKEALNSKATPFEVSSWIEEQFPELAESEDEKIREGLIGHLKELKEQSVEGSHLKCPEHYDAWISWLEKQGEQILANSAKTCKDEHNSTDKVEPKFKGGEWVVNKLGDSWHIDSFGKKNYQVSDGKGKYNFFPISKQEEMHPWSIQDAKDGDVLATDSWLYVFKYTNNKALIQFHCNCPINGKLYKWCALPDDCYLDIYINANIHPATKEQRDLLFQKMKELGYEWDEEKKELKKIEQKPTDSIPEDFEKYVEQLLSLSDGEGHGSPAKVKEVAAELFKLANLEQKPAWSEEDKRILYNVKAYIGYAAGQRGVKDELFKEANEWLNSLPIGFIYNKNYNEDMVTLLVGELKQIANNNNAPEQYQAEINWLKSLKDKHTWKPSDEQIIALRWVLNNVPYNKHKEEISGLLDQIKEL